MNNFLEKVKLNTRKPNWLEYLFPMVLWVVWLFLYAYEDFKTLTIWSTTFLDCLADGKLYDYYAVVHENIYGLYHEYCGYNYLAVILWAIWNIPIWIMQRFFGILILEHPLMLLWSHLFLLVLLGVTIYFANKIVRMFVNDSTVTAWNTYMIITYPFIFIGVILAGQTDIIAVTITVVAVYFLLKDRQWIFILLMCVSIALKPFFIFAYIALILLTEKNLIKIVLKLASGLVLMLLFNIIYSNAPLYKESMDAGTGSAIIENTVHSGIPANITYTAPFVIMGLVIIYFFAYCINYNKSKNKKYYVIYLIVASMFTYFCFSNYEFYRLIYMAPFLMILVAINRKVYRLNVILETIFSVVGVFLMNYTLWASSVRFFNQDVMSVFGWEKDVEVCRYYSLYDVFADKLKDSFPMFQNIAAGVFVTVAAIMIIINIPYVSKKIKQPVVKCERWIYQLGTITLYIMMGMLWMCYFIDWK